MKTLVEMFIFSLSKGLIKIVKWSADLLGTVSVFIVDLNADIRGCFTNLNADYQKLRLEIDVGI